MRGFNYDGSHPEVMAACKLASSNSSLSEKSTVLLKILANKTGTQFVAGWEAHFSPQILQKQKDSFWDSCMRLIAKQALPGMLWVHLQQHTQTACKLTLVCWLAPRTC
jgi:hypothetical protein